MRISVVLFQTTTSKEPIDPRSPASAAHLPVHDSLLRSRERRAGTGRFFNFAAFAEVAKKVQMDTVDLMLTAGKDVAAEARTVAETVVRDNQIAVKKATAAATTVAAN